MRSQVAAFSRHLVDRMRQRWTRSATLPPPGIRSPVSSGHRSIWRVWLVCIALIVIVTSQDGYTIGGSTMSRLTRAKRTRRTSASCWPNTHRATSPSRPRSSGGAIGSTANRGQHGHPSWIDWRLRPSTTNWPGRYRIYPEITRSRYSAPTVVCSTRHARERVEIRCRGSRLLRAPAGP